MTQQNSIPRLHMGCGEALRSQWLLSGVHTQHKSAVLLCKLQDERRKRGRVRG
jgi:hypothetical protein